MVLARLTLLSLIPLIIDATSYDKISKDERRPLYSILPTVKHSCYRLRRKTFQLPFIVNTQTPAELSINYNLAI